MNSTLPPAANAAACVEMWARQFPERRTAGSGDSSPREEHTVQDCLLAVYEVVVDQEDLSQHIRDKELNSLRRQFWKLRKAASLQNQRGLARQLEDANRAAGAGAFSDPVPSAEALEVQEHLAAAEADIAAISAAAESVQPSKRIQQVLAQLPAHMRAATKESPDWPAALYERKWLRTNPPGWAFGADAQPAMDQAAQDMDDLFEDNGLKFPSKPVPPVQRPDVPRSWLDSSRPAHEKLGLEMMGHVRRMWHLETSLSLSDRSPLMALEVRLVLSNLCSCGSAGLAAGLGQLSGWEMSLNNATLAQAFWKALRWVLLELEK